jgi:cell division protein FtsI (penicillin-binding protein 3)
MTGNKKTYIKLRVTFVGMFFFIMVSGIGARAVYLQVFCGSWLSEKAAAQYETAFIQKSKRGTIYDRNMQDMAVSIDATSVTAVPCRVQDKKSAAKQLSKILKIDMKHLYEKLQTNQGFTWVKRQVTPKEVDAVKALKIDGIDFVPEYTRFYPNKELAAQVIGFTGMDGNGLEGIEYIYDQALLGREQKFIVLKDALGRRFAKDKSSAAKDVIPLSSGKNIILTIDRTIQYITESALASSVMEFEAKSGMAVVMNPATGAILAMAHTPTFNPNIFNSYPRELWRNRCITDPFEPGSTMKIFTTAAALESGICGPNTIFFCENGAYKIGKDTIHDTHPRGWLSLQQIVKYSSNIGISKVMEVVGPENLYRSLVKFGFGEKTGLGCPGETCGSLTPFNRWTNIDSSTIAFGQGISVSAIQLIAAASSLANGGLLMKPYIVEAVTNDNGRIIERTEPVVVRRTVRPDTASAVNRIMQTVIMEGGTGTNAALDGYIISGKTGTAQKIDESRTYANGKYVSSFLGFAPAAKPAAVILVVIDEPQSAHYGGTVAAPAFRKIAHETLQYLNVPPEIKKNGLQHASLKSEVDG